MFKCDLCPRSFGCRTGLIWHLKNSHKVVSVALCSLCCIAVLCGHGGVWEEDGPLYIVVSAILCGHVGGQRMGCQLFVLCYVFFLACFTYNLLPFSSPPPPPTTTTTTTSC